MHSEISYELMAIEMRATQQRLIIDQKDED